MMVTLSNLEVATGVDAVRFTFYSDGTPFGLDVYREIDIIGTATQPVPEPATCVALAAGILGLAKKRRKA
ncbi:MAG: PEP-CTERM sorting domain-containing protein [Fimbriimonas sp.]